MKVRNQAAGAALMVQFFRGVRLARRGCPWGCPLPIFPGMVVTTGGGRHAHREAAA